MHGMKVMFYRLWLAITSPVYLFTTFGTGRRWLAPLLIVSCLNGLVSLSVQRSEIGLARQRQQRLETYNRYRDRLTNKQYEVAVANVDAAVQPPAFSSLIDLTLSSLIYSLIIGVVLHATFSFLTAKQDVPMSSVICVIAYAFTVVAVGRSALALLTFGTGLGFWSGALPDMLQFLNWPDRYSFAGIFFRAYDLLQIWSICITAIGLAALFELRARVIGFGLVTTFTVALLVFAGFVTVATGPQKGRSLRHGSAGSPIGAVSPLLTSDGV